MANIVNITTDTSTVAETMGGLDTLNAGVYKGTKIPIRKMTGHEIVTVSGTTAGAKVLSDQTWITDRFGKLGAREIKKLRAIIAARTPLDN